MLHPIISIPMAVLLDLISRLIKKCFAKIDCFNIRKKCHFSFSMTLYVALLLTFQYFMTDKWEDYRTFIIDQQNQTGQVAVVKSSFANQLFEQCNCVNEKKKYSCVRSYTDINTTSNIEEFLKDKVIDSGNLLNLLLGLIGSLLVCYLIEICIDKPVSLLQFLLGPKLRKSTERQEEIEDAIELNELEAVNNSNLQPGQNSRRKKKRLMRTLFQIACVSVVLIFVIVTILPLVLPLDNIHFKFYVWKDSECPSGYFDANNNLNSGNDSNFFKCEGKSWIQN